jgi:hypothetical protein
VTRTTFVDELRTDCIVCDRWAERRGTLMIWTPTSDELPMGRGVCDCWAERRETLMIRTPSDELRIGSMVCNQFVSAIFVLASSITNRQRCVI